MQNTFDIGHLSNEDKLRVMEAIWEDLSKEDMGVESPSWHQEALQETEQRLNLGKRHGVKSALDSPCQNSSIIKAPQKVNNLS